MTATITRPGKSGEWTDGTVGRYRFEAKVYDESSHYGINGGRVSKLAIWDEKVRDEKCNFDEACIIQYDRSNWGIKPNQENQPYLDAVLALFS